MDLSLSGGEGGFFRTQRIPPPLGYSLGLVPPLPPSSYTYKLLVAFHSGETEYNKNGIIQGQSDVLLSAAGLEQAEAVAKRLAPERFDLIFSSDLSRAYKVCLHPLLP